MGITHTTFFDVAPDPSLASAKEGAAAMTAFQPDCIIAIGGGSAMDAAKIMWVLYEHPDADFLDMAMRFMRHPQAHLHLPPHGRKGVLHRHPHHRRHRQRGHALCGHHRSGHRRQVSAGRL